MAFDFQKYRSCIVKLKGSAAELKILKRLENKKNIVELIFFDETRPDGQVPLVLEHCDISLGDYLESIKPQPLAPNTTKHLFSQIAQSLFALFEENIIHRDFKYFSSNAKKQA